MATRHTRIVERALTRLKLRQLRLLVAVGQHGSIQNAAQDLNISQPAATKMIQDLEYDFEVKLFDRRKIQVFVEVSYNACACGEAHPPKALSAHGKVQHRPRYIGVR